jgi:chromosome partitioning protein
MKIIAIASRKGGVGKTTLAGHLAVAAERAGQGPVGLMDIDPQGNLSDWWNARPVASPLYVRIPLERLAGEIENLRTQGLEYLIVDTPPTVNAEVGDLIGLSELVVIPTRPGPHDLRSIGATIELAERLGKPLVFVVNAAVANARITNETLALLSRHGHLAPTVVHQRVAFASSMIDGRTVMELAPKSPGSEEIESLWSYLHQRIAGARPTTTLGLGTPAAAPQMRVALTSRQS